jgi:tRNA G46 methylase TrmB
MDRQGTEMTDHRLYSPSAARNREAILAVLRQALPARGLVLEIASGTGEHAVHFAAALPQLHFQPSDPDPEALASIAAWIAHEKLSNVAPPVLLDAAVPDWPIAAAKAVICINMVHILWPVYPQWCA